MISMVNYFGAKFCEDRLARCVTVALTALRTTKRLTRRK